VKQASGDNKMPDATGLPARHHRQVDLASRNGQEVIPRDPRNQALGAQTRYQALPERRKLVALAGSPKTNRLFYSRSTGYKRILNNLDNYRRKTQPLARVRLESPIGDL
jgi:hypothetical protein